MPQGIAEYLDSCFLKFVEPLVHELGLTVKERRVEGLGGLYDVEGDVLLIRLTNDRGVTDLSVAPRHTPGDLWDIALIETSLRGHPPRGVWQPTLEEQVDRVRNSWSELNEMFAPATYPRTRKMLSTVGEERAARLFGRNFLTHRKSE